MFTGVSSNHNVYVDDVLQKTFIEVDENGTEASAATAVIMAKATSARPEPEIIKEFKADKPFIYFIMDEDTKEILFMGEYAFAK
jgi:serpin B